MQADVRQDELNRMVKRLFGPEFKIGVMRYVLSFIGVLIIGSILIAWQGEDPIRAVEEIVVGAFGGRVQFGNTLRWATPCLLTGAASIVAFKSGVTNLGIEGQMYVGAVTAGILGYMVELRPIRVLG